MDRQHVQDPTEDLDRLAAAGDAEEIDRYVEGLSTADAARALSRLSEDAQTHLLGSMEAPEAAELVDRLPDAQAAELIETLDPQVAAAIIQELPSNEQADLIGDLDESDAEAILSEMVPEAAVGARALSQYADDVAGGLMATEVLSFREDQSVQEIIDDLRAQADRYRDYHIQYVYATDRNGRLVGVVPIRSLLMSRHEDLVRTIMVADPRSVPVDQPLAELIDLFERVRFFGVPVVDSDHHLLGVVQRSAVEQAAAERAESDGLKARGIVSEELRTMPLWRRSSRRLAWLSVNIVLNILAASVIVFYEETLTAVVAIAVFLPIISDMSGCSGNQAVAVSLRELTLGVARASDVVEVWLKEIGIGLINGLVLGILIGLAAWAWKGNPYLGLVVGGAMAVNTVVAVSVGGCVPLVLKRFGVDPALASSPILTTITDMCGFFFALSFATIMLSQLTSP